LFESLDHHALLGAVDGIGCQPIASGRV
jgi:hypothetical protein